MISISNKLTVYILLLKAFVYNHYQQVWRYGLLRLVVYKFCAIISAFDVIQYNIPVVI